jgi:hypothetical protein
MHWCKRDFQERWKRERERERERVLLSKWRKKEEIEKISDL